MVIGEIKEIIRHPVKSFRGEKVMQTTIESYGLYGDRSHAFLDETRPGKYFTATQFPPMVRYHAEFIGVENYDEFPRIKISSPLGKTYEWGDKELLEELESISNKKISPINYFPNDVPFGAIEEEHILITTDASLTKMEDIWGEKVDIRRFRPNIVINLYDDKPFVEDTWFGKHMKIGHAELKIKRHCERCTMIAIDPENGIFDLSLLKKVGEERNNHFGVYASVIVPGSIQVGDQISIFDHR